VIYGPRPAAAVAAGAGACCVYRPTGKGVPQTFLNLRHAGPSSTWAWAAASLPRGTGSGKRHMGDRRACSVYGSLSGRKEAHREGEREGGKQETDGLGDGDLHVGLGFDCAKQVASTRPLASGGAWSGTDRQGQIARNKGWVKRLHGF